MNLKTVFKDHYHQLYRTIRLLDDEVRDRTAEELITMLKNHISELSAFVNMLAYVDEQLPLLRCQAALGKFDQDMVGLYLTYLEERLIGLDATLYDETKDIDAVLAMEEAAEKVKYGKSVHQLYLNTIHATEQVIVEHVDQLNDDGLRIRVLDYFKNLMEVGSEHFDRSDFDGLDLLISELSFNFSVIKRIRSKEAIDDVQIVEEKFDRLRKSMRHRILYLDTIKKLQLHGYREELLDKDLTAKIAAIEKEIIGSRNKFEAFGLSLIPYLTQLLWHTDTGEDSVHPSIPAINLRETYK